MQTCDINCSPPLWGEKKYAFRWGPVNICNMNCIINADVWQKLLSHLGRWIANVHWSPAKSIFLFLNFHVFLTFWRFFNFCHTSAWIWPSRLQMFTGPQREAYFFSPHKGGEQLLSHVCRNMAIQPANVHWSPARSILFFSKIHPWILTSIWHYVFQGFELRYPKKH